MGGERAPAWGSYPSEQLRCGNVTHTGTGIPAGLPLLVLGHNAH